jgi:hypothetical protein
MAKSKLSEGDVLLIPVAPNRFAAAKVLFLSKRIKNMMLIGVSTNKTVEKVAMPAPLPPFDARYYTGSQLVGSEWPVVGHDASPIDPDASKRVSAGMVSVRDEKLHIASPSEVASLPREAVLGAGLVVKKIQDALGLPRGEQKTQASELAATMDDARFWSILEDAWAAAPKEAKRRPTGANEASADALAKVDEALEERVLPALRKALKALPKDELAAFDRSLERKLYELDRADVQRHTDGSDDGFLYARGFIVAMGRSYYDAVLAEPSSAIMDMECESICYLPKQLYEEAHGRLAPSGISRETGSNKAGWARARK